MPETSPTRARILVVEDHDDLAEALTYNLQQSGYAAESVPDGLDALRAIRQRVPDLVVLDVNLPRLGGFDVLARLRADGVWCPVLVLSARTSPADKVEGFRVGADDYVTKPFTVAELLGRIGALLRRRTPPTVPGDAARGRFGGLAAVGEPPAAPRGDIIGYTDAQLMEKFGLTSRQAAVARLLAHGLTNPEIASTLAISRFTVRNHAEQVLAKLGVAGRGRVASALRAAYDAEFGSAA